MEPDDNGKRNPDEDDIPDTPLDEPSPEPIQDPPAEPGPQGPYIVGFSRAPVRWRA
jgi:hypothetical protein